MKVFVQNASHLHSHQIKGARHLGPVLLLVCQAARTVKRLSINEQVEPKDPGNLNGIRNKSSPALSTHRAQEGIQNVNFNNSQSKRGSPGTRIMELVLEGSKVPTSSPPRPGGKEAVNPVEEGWCQLHVSPSG